MSVAPPPEPILTIAGLARVWARTAGQTTYLAMSGEEIERLLTQLIARLVVAAAATPVDEQAAIEVAAELIAHDLTGSRSLGRSIELLAYGLPRLTELQDIEGRDIAVPRVLAALCDGYVAALRRRILDEQEQVAQALLRAKLEAEARFQEVFRASTVGIAISTFDDVIVEANQAFSEIVDRLNTNLTGASLRELLQAENDRTLTKEYRKLSDGKLVRFKYRRQVTDTSGDLLWTHLGGSLIRDADGVPTHFLTVVENINELHLLQQELSRQALHDALTVLPNETYLMSRLQEVLETARPSTEVTLCLMKLDNFFVVSDGMGRAAGDALLCSIARQLGELMQDQPAMVARLNRDEFAILIEDGPNRPASSALGPLINEMLSEPFYLNEVGLAVSASVGVVRRPARDVSAAELMSSASITLRRAERSGGGQWDLYDAEYEDHERANLRLAAGMPGAFENGEITLRYQPVCELDQGRIVAIQALLRWERADGTVLDHATCLALAKWSGLLGPLGRWMIKESCRVHSQVVQDPAFVALLLRVDLTTHLSQDPDLIETLNDALSDAELGAEQLWIGVPLLALIRRHGDLVDNVNVLTQLGAKVLMLGTSAGHGYMTFFEDFPISGVELSPEIVARIAARPGDDSVVNRAIYQSVSLARSADATVIVPGIDTPEQEQWWRSTGADWARGLCFAGPAPASELLELLRRRFRDDT